MKYVFFILLAAMILIAGCLEGERPISSPNWNTSPSESIPMVEVTELPHETLHPLETSSAYVRPERPATIETTSPERWDPVVGYWKYVGSHDYLCDALFHPDGNGSILCIIVGSNLGGRMAFEWKSVPSSYAWMRNYTLMDMSTGMNYTIAYSENTGEITGEVIPEGYLVKVS